MGDARREGRTTGATLDGLADEILLLRMAVCNGVRAGNERIAALAIVDLGRALVAEKQSVKTVDTLETLMAEVAAEVVASP